MAQGGQTEEHVGRADREAEEADPGDERREGERVRVGVGHKLGVGGLEGKLGAADDDDGGGGEKIATGNETND